MEEYKILTRILGGKTHTKTDMSAVNIY